MNEKDIFTKPTDALALIAIEIMKTQGDFEAIKDNDFAEDSFRNLLPAFRKYYNAALDFINTEEF